MANAVLIVMNDRAAMPLARRNLEVWWLAQPLEERKEHAKDFRKRMETFKLIGEGLFTACVELTMGDV